MRAAENAPRGPCRFLKCIYSLAEIVERGAGVPRDANATLDDLRAAVTMLEDVERTARRVLGGANPLTGLIERSLEESRATLRARETPSPR